MRAFLAAVAVPAAVHAAGEWEEWVSVHAKVYASDVQARYRQSVFEANLLSFAEQTRYDTATFGPDAYADLTVDEFVAARAGCFTGNGFDSISPAPAVALLRHRVGDDTSVDWRDPTKNPAKVNGVTRVKNQGPYGYCWAFGCTGTLEGMNVIQQKNPLEELSEQQLIDCCSPGNVGAESCWGHGPQSSWNFLLNHTHGVDSTEESYPYQLKARHGDNNMSCALKSMGGTGKTVNGTTIVPGTARLGSYVSAATDKTTGNQDTILAALLKYGPGNIGVDAHCLFGYKRGIISNCTGKSVDHATLLVGAGIDTSVRSSSGGGAGMPYWIVKNRSVHIRCLLHSLSSSLPSQ